MRRWTPTTEEVIYALGGTNRVAALLGITRQAIELWRDVPIQHVLRLERELEDLDSAIDRYDMRPEIYGPRPRPKLPPSKAVECA